MNLLRSIVRGSLFVALNLAVAAALAAPRNSALPDATPEAAPRIQGSVDEAARVVLPGNVHPLIQAAAGQAGRSQARPAQSGLSQSGTDLGAVEGSLPAGRMLLLLQRSPEQEAALRDFIQAAHTPGSPSFHQWLKPEEFGRIYGPAGSDVAAISAWLESHGLTINQVHAGRLAIEFSGTAGQVSEAFQTADSPLSGQRRDAPGQRNRSLGSGRARPGHRRTRAGERLPSSAPFAGAGTSPVQPQNSPGRAPMDLSGGRRGRLCDGAGGFCHAV